MKDLKEFAAALLAGSIMGLFVVFLMVTGDCYQKHKEKKRVELNSQVQLSEEHYYQTSDGFSIEYVCPEPDYRFNGICK